MQTKRRAGACGREAAGGTERQCVAWSGLVHEWKRLSYPERETSQVDGEKRIEKSENFLIIQTVEKMLFSWEKYKVNH